MATLANLLRKRKTIASKLGTFSERAVGGAVTETVDGKENKPDFDTQENVELFKSTQHELRKIKSAVAETTSTKKVSIPEDIPVPEAGQEVSLYQAILIRDDLKSQKNLLERVSKLSSGVEKRKLFLRETSETTEKVRHFDFDEFVKMSDSLQEYIDKVDALIQYTDNTLSVEI